MPKYETVIGVVTGAGLGPNPIEQPLPDELEDVEAEWDGEAIQKSREIVRRKAEAEEWDKTYRLKAVKKIVFQEK